MKKKVTVVIGGIYKQLEKLIDHYIHSCPNDPEYLLRAFHRGVGWIACEPYTDMHFEINYADFTFQKLCNIYGLLKGTVAEYDFTAELGQQVQKVVLGRLQLYFDQTAADELRKDKHELEKELLRI